tara:strand:+ start:157 stop:492 length:336 start_codon:yes stop_codon:yes gene_type:complete
MFKSLTGLNYFFGLLIKDPVFWGQGRLLDCPKMYLAPLQIKRSKDKSFFYFVRTTIKREGCKCEDCGTLPKRILKRKFSEITESDLEQAVAEYHHDYNPNSSTHYQVHSSH